MVNNVPPYLAATVKAASPELGRGIVEAYWRLLEEQTYTAKELHAAGINPDVTPNLIHLDDANGVAQYPAFQFDLEQHQVREIVVRINAMFSLDKHDDHMAVWQWWSCANSYLPDNANPVSQLGTLPDEYLVLLAEVVTGDM